MTPRSESRLPPPTAAFPQTVAHSLPPHESLTKKNMENYPAVRCGEKQVQEAKEALVAATTDADNTAKAAAEAAAKAEAAEAAAEAATEAAEAAQEALEEAEEAVLAAEEKEKMCRNGSASNENNGFGNGDQDAPGNSLENNNAENAQDTTNGGSTANNQNNGFGNGDQDAPGNSLENNNAENAQSTKGKGKGKGKGKK